MTPAKQQYRIVRRSSRAANLVRTLRYLGLGLFLLLGNIGILSLYSYTRGGEGARVHAAVPATLNFQARLLQSNGTVVPDGNYSVSFNLYTASSGGSPVWNEVHGTVPVRSGYLSVYLGDVDNDLDTLDWSQQYWLTMNVNGDGEMNPRLRLTSVPYSFRSSQADGITNGAGILEADDIAQLAPSSIQAVNTALAALRINQTGAGGFIEFENNGNDAFVVANDGTITSDGDATFEGGALNLGNATQSGGLVLSDGSSNTLTIQTGSLSGNLLLTLPTTDGANGDCIKTNGSGVLSFAGCAGSNSFVNGGNGFGALAVLGTTDSNSLQFITSNTQAVLIDTSGNMKIGSGSAVEKLDVGGGIRIGNSTGTNAGTIRWNGTDFQGYDGTQWKSFTTSGGNANATASFVSGLANVAANATGASVEMLHFTSATAVSNIVGTTGFTAAADGSFRTCLVRNNANITGGTLNLRWRVNGASVGAGVCTMNSTDNRQKSEMIDAGVVTFSAGDTIGVAFDSVGLAPTTNDFTVFWSIEYNSGTSGGGASSLQEAYDGSGSPATIMTSDGKDIAISLTDTTTDSNFLIDILSGSGGRFAIQDNGADAFSVTSSAVTISKVLAAAAGLNLSNSGITNAGSITGVGANITGTGALTLASGGSGNLTLSAASGLVSLGATTVQTSASLGLDLNNASNTVLTLQNTGSGNASLNLGDGGLQTAGTTRLTNAGALQNITGLTITSGGADITGGLNLNSDGLTNAGNITGVGTDITATAGLEIASSGSGDLTLTSNSGLLVLNASTWQRIASGTTMLELNDTSDTTLQLINTDSTAVLNLSVEGDITADGFNGNGSGLTQLNAGNLTSGTVNDSLLSGNVALLNQIQTFTARATFNNGLVLGNTSNTTAGALRWTGTDFEGYDGSGWVSLTSGGGGGGSTLLEGVWALGKVAANGTAINVDGASVTRNGTGNYTVTFDTAMAASTYVVQLTAEEDSGTLAEVQISVDNQTVNGFDVLIHEGNDASGTDTLVDRIWHFVAFDQSATAGGGMTPSNAFVQNGNDFGAVAILGTTSNYGMNFITNSVVAFSVDNAGSVNFVNDVTVGDTLTVSSGGLDITGNSTISGSLGGLTGLSIVSGGASIIGGIDNNGDDIINIGALSGVTSISASGAISAATTTDTINGLIINGGALSGINGLTFSSGNLVLGGGNLTGLGSNLTANGALTIATGASGDLTLDSASNIINLEAGETTLRRAAAGNYTIELNSNSATGLVLNNTGSAAANLVLTDGALSTGSTPTVRLTNAGALQNITTLGLSGAISGATATNTINGLVINTGTLSSVTGITFSSGNLVLGGGNISGVGTLALSGAISGATSTDTINGLVINSGSLSAVTGFTQTNGTFSVTGTGAITLGGGSNALTINSTAFDVTSAGAVSGVTTLITSGDITSGGTFVGNGQSGDTLAACANNQYIGNAVKIDDGLVTAGTCRNDGVSDARIKKNITAVGDGILDKIQAVNTVEFDFRCGEAQFADAGMDCFSGRQTGVIAQELAQVFPGLVYQNDIGYYNVKYQGLSVLTLKAVQELSREVDSIQEASGQVRTLSTGETLRLDADGVLQNITGLKMISGGASVIGGIDNNNGGITEVGTISGATTIDAQKLILNSSGTENMLELKKDGNGVFTVFHNGALELRLDANNTFAVKKANGEDVFSINTNGGLVQIGSGTADEDTVLLVLDSKSTEGDPTGVNGAQYYNSATGKFRCYQNDKWQDCLPAANTEYIVSSSTHSWSQAAGESEMVGRPKLWVDFTTAREFRLTTTVNTAGTAGTVCRLQYTLDEASNDWQNLAWTGDNGILLDKTGAIRGEWIRVSPGAQAEVLIRVMCRSTSLATSTPSITGLRLQIR